MNRPIETINMHALGGGTPAPALIEYAIVGEPKPVAGAIAPVELELVIGAVTKIL